MNTPFVLTPGPTYISETVRREMSRELTNPDIDLQFYDFYKNLCKKLQKIMHTKNEVLILCGEGILGLEAACCSLTEENDRVLIIDNGIFGAGFKGFVEMYGGKAVMYSADYDKAIDVEKLRAFLEKDSNFKYATVVHCETPSGITNPVNKICPLLKEYGIMTVTDSVSGIGGEELLTDEWDMDIVLGGSQKCLSAPVGLTFLSISPKAKAAILNRKTPIKSFYCNLAAFEGWYEKKWFPYTMPIHLIYALDKAADRLLEQNSVKKHALIAEAVRYAVVESGLELYPKNGFSNTLTAVNVPDCVKFEDIQKGMLDKYNILTGSSFGYLLNKVIRIGHMGENCNEEYMYLYLKALEEVITDLGVSLKSSLSVNFAKKLYEEKQE